MNEMHGCCDIPVLMIKAILRSMIIHVNITHMIMLNNLVSVSGWHSGITAPVNHFAIRATMGTNSILSYTNILILIHWTINTT